MIVGFIIYLILSEIFYFSFCVLGNVIVDYSPLPKTIIVFNIYFLYYTLMNTSCPLDFLPTEFFEIR